MLRLVISTFLITLFTLVGCTDDLGKEAPFEHDHSTENPTAEEILRLNPEADIFQFNGVIYETNIDWVEKEKTTKDKPIGEIKTKNDTDTNFEDEMSNKLPIGAKIYSSHEWGDMILLVEWDGEIYKYYAIVEG